MNEGPARPKIAHTQLATREGDPRDRCWPDMHLVCQGCWICACIARTRPDMKVRVTTVNGRTLCQRCWEAEQ